MATVYSIRDWNGHFEVAQSRKIEGALQWVAMPCKHDGLAFRRIMLMPDGPEIYCAWVLIVQVAAKCPVRGILADHDGPLDASDLALKTGCRQDVFEKALKVLSGPKIAWIVGVKWEPSGSALPLQDSTRQDIQDRTVQDTDGAADAADRDEGESADSELRDWLRWWNSLHADRIVSSGVTEEEPSRGVLTAWKRVQQQTKEGRRLRALLADRDAIEREIRTSTFLREAWFRLEKLLGGKNRDGEWIVQKIIDGGYRDERKPNGKRVGEGQRHPEDRSPVAGHR